MVNAPLHLVSAHRGGPSDAQILVATVTGSAKAISTSLAH